MDTTAHDGSAGPAGTDSGGSAGAPAAPFAVAGRPRVLQVLPAMDAGGGGVERTTVDIAAALADAGAGALVTSAGGAQLRLLERHDVEHVALPLQRKNLLSLWRNAGRLERLIRRCGIDIVHARSRGPAWSALIAARRTGRPFVTTFHGTYSHRTPLRRLYSSVMARGDRVIANSEFIARHVRRVYRVPDGRLTVIPRGVDTDILSPASVGDARLVSLAARWRLADGVRLVMLPGRLTRWKGQALLIEAMTMVDGAGVVCYLVGSDQGRTAYRRELERLIERRGLAGRVATMDHCDDMPAAYKLADVIVSASTRPEAFGRVVSEAQAMGRPVVVADHGGAPEQILPGRTGWTFPPGNAGALAAGIRRALDLDAGARAALAEQARANTVARFGRRAMCTATLDVYAEILQEKAQGAASGAGA